jgi:hypothetical protein
VLVFTLRCCAAVLIFAAALNLAAHGQSTSAVDAAAKIQDNSFLLEEAYNQETGVVQHIFSFTRLFQSRDWVLSFTQEWPAPTQRHQLSYTLVGTSAGDFPKSGAGLGDMAINYRFQAIGSGETRLAVAPRVSALLPLGDERRGRGFGGAGVQVNLPVSYELLPRLVAHWNAGTTVIPHARNELGQKGSLTAFNAGQGLIWLLRPNFNLMLETVWNNSQSIIGPGTTARSNELLLSPGMRWAYNFDNGLQIVPGIAVPLGVGPSNGERGILIYLSFEHPFRRATK